MNSKSYGHNIWLIPANENRFRMLDWMKTHDYISWDQHVNYQIGDEIYIYCSAPVKAIIGRCVVDKINLRNYIDHEEDPYQVPANSTRIAYPRVAAFIGLERTYNQKELCFQNLINHGLKGSVQGPKKLSGELLQYIEDNF